jgi:hypothetical protein
MFFHRMLMKDRISSIQKVVIVSTMTGRSGRKQCSVLPKVTGMLSRRFQSRQGPALNGGLKGWDDLPVMRET